MAHRFYTNLPLMRGELVLDGPEAHHLAAVSRHRVGDHVILFNGDGADYLAEICDLHKRQVVLQVVEKKEVNREIGFRLEVAAPVPKGDRGDFLIEKLTELGVTHFVPLQTVRSVVQPRETKLDRLRQKVIEASKQCGRNVMMIIEPLAEWGEYCRAPRESRRFIAHPGGVRWGGLRGMDVTFAIGPEGGFTDEEVALAVQSGWERLDLGERLLRIETAALMVAALAIGES